MILTIDYGTTNLKAALIDEKGNFHYYYSESVEIKSDNLVHEVKSFLYIDFLINYLKKIDRSLIDAIIISSNGPSFLSLYSDIKINNHQLKYDASNTRLWMDKRGKNYSKIVSSFYKTYIDGSFFLPSILNIRENEKEQYDKTLSFITIDGFINYFLTNKKYIVNNADLLMKYYWDDSSLKEFNLDKSKFPDFIDCGKIISTLDNNVASFLNLNPNIKVIAGGSDFYFSLIGSNITKENIIADINGTSEGINLCTKKYIKDNRFLCYEHPLKGYFNLSGVISNSGVAINWIRKILNIEASNFDLIYELAQKSDTNNLIFLPYLNGERAPIWNPKATGSFFNIKSTTSKADLARAVIEGTIFSFKSVIDEFTKLNCDIDEIHTTSKNLNRAFYYQLKSDILEKKLIVYHTKAVELSGLASLYYNKYKQINIFNKDIISKTYYPNSDNIAYYKNKYKKFKALYEATKTLMD